MSAAPATTSQATASTVEKAIDVLFHLHESPGPRGVTAVAEALDLPKSSVHRLLSSLSARGLVEQDEQSLYRPGIGLVALGLGALDREPVVAAARPVLEEEARELGETFFLVGHRAGELVVLDKAEGTGFLRAAPRVGSTVPVHATAVGKLYLAFGQQQVAMPQSPWEAFTDTTLTDREALEAAVQETRRRGWAANLDEWIQGLSVIAAPVTAGDRLVAVAVLALPSHRVTELGIDGLAGRVVSAGERIACRLEGSGR